MKAETRYWGSVRFYKHLILTVTALMILVPNIGLMTLLIRHYRLKQNYQAAAAEQTAYINQLEEKLAYFLEDTINGDIDPDTKGSQLVPDTPGQSTITDADMLSIPFSVDLTDWRYILVNDQHPLAESFQPELVETRNEKLIHKKIRASLELMLDDAKKEGLDIIICSAYRDYEHQARLVAESMEKLMKMGHNYTEAHWKTKLNLALVGTSEHHTGLAVDLVGTDYQTLDEKQADTPEAKWLAEHAYEYGFILRYPEGKENITGIIYESWHFRYVGRTAAAFITENQLCLEEFIELAKKQK